MSGGREGRHQPRNPTTSHYFRPETSDRKQTVTTSAPSSPNAASQPFGSGGLRGLGSILGSRRPAPGSRTPGAARAAREDGGRRATAPPALATGQAERHLSVLRPAAPTPRSRFRGDLGSPLGRDKKSKKTNKKKKTLKNKTKKKKSKLKKKSRHNKRITKAQKALPASHRPPSRRLAGALRVASAPASRACSGDARSSPAWAADPRQGLASGPATATTGPACSAAQAGDEA